MDEEQIKHQLNLELESISCNQLNDLGNAAVKQGLILGHGYRGGQYEILRRSEVVLLPPGEAQLYLQQLLDDAKA